MWGAAVLNSFPTQEIHGESKGTVDPIEEDLNYLMDPVSLHPAKASQIKYNGSAARGYAYNWWDGRNSHYYDFSSSGGDCANFVSQCLIAGGLSLHNGTDGDGYGVYPDSDRPSSQSFGTIPYCDYLNTHLRNYQATNVTYVTDDAPYVLNQITLGDVVIFGDKAGDHYKHAMVVVSDIGSDVGLAGHSSNVWDRSFFVELSYFSCATFYHINETDSKFFHFRVDTSSLNVRVGPGLDSRGSNYQDIGDIHDSEEYIAYETELDENGKMWWHFWFDDRAAWCASWYTINVTGNIIFEPDVQDYLNVRDGPGTGYTAYTQLYHGMKYVTQSIDGIWYKIWCGGAVGYVHGGYVTHFSPYLANNLTSTVMGFLPYWNTRSLNITTLTHLAWFSVEMNSDGTMGNTHGWPEWDVINQAHANGTKVVLTTTMFSSSAIHTLLASSSYRTAAITNLLTQVQEGNADGICIDFENPETAGDNVLLIQFMEELHTTFKNARADYHISLCTPPRDWWGTYDYDGLAPHLDHFMFMGYGYSGSWSSNAGPMAPLEGGSLNVNDSIHDILEYGTGIDSEQVILGVPFYGYDFKVNGDPPVAKATVRASGSSRFYDWVEEFLAANGTIVPNYDATAETAWFNYYQVGDGWRQVWYDNLTSFEVKCDYALDNNLSGIGIWASGYQGPLGEHPELDALIWNTFQADRAPPVVEIKLPLDFVNDSLVEIRWTGSDDREIVGYELRCDDSPWVDLGLMTSYEMAFFDGIHNVTIRGKDSSDKITEVTQQFTVDTNRPSPPSGLAATPESWSSENNFSVSWINPTDLSGISAAYYSIDLPPTSFGDGNPEYGVDIEKISNLTVTADGVHNVYVWLEDAAGNMDFNYYRSCSLKLDTQAPLVNITLPPDLLQVYSENFYLTWATFDATSGIENVSLEVIGMGSSNLYELSRNASYFSLPGLDPGNYTCTITVYDYAGNLASQAVEVKILSPIKKGDSISRDELYVIIASVGLACLGGGILFGYLVLRNRGKPGRQYIPDLGSKKD